MNAIEGQDDPDKDDGENEEDNTVAQVQEMQIREEREREWAQEFEQMQDDHRQIQQMESENQQEGQDDPVDINRASEEMQPQPTNMMSNNSMAMV